MKPNELVIQLYSTGLEQNSQEYKKLYTKVT